ncbi:sodium-coupled monocarboxylate transporter 1-like isoform X1 [Photinus pyralis]|uniref:sodium-coupled monocarboxylate transporter 1-like isoform X1 n=1 Tax=Photinus pyralis TaxID=7054 RepID=UPI00126741A8|nr:sodium-coupled monocarboxylate transporter 1-like isoform X1 [Photinus pyralis]
MLGDGDEKLLSLFDYILFALTLLGSFLVGAYFGLSKNKPRTTEEYLIGGKSVNVLPIAISLVASGISGNTFLAVPADIYKFGSNYVWTLLADCIGFLATYYIFLPIYFNLQVVSIFEYLEQRFDKNVRRLTSVLNLCATLCYAPLVLYLPSLAFSQVSGIPVHAITVVTCLTCTLYTTVGGFKAVVWTDALQFVLMVGSVIAVVGIGAHSVGGLWQALAIAVRGDRWEIFNFSFDLTSRNPLWGPMVGHIFFALSTLTMNQGAIQKYMGLKKFQDVKKCICLHLVGHIALKWMTVLIGNVAYAKYVECDVLQSHKIAKIDQLVPYFVLDIAGSIKGLPGLFIAGMFSAALSSLSSTLNATAATIYEDIILPFISKNTTQRQNTNIIKAIVAVLGILTILMAFLVERVGGIYPFTLSLQGSFGGPLVGIFILGVLVPAANSKGTLLGGIAGVLLTGWIAFGNTVYKIQGLLPTEEKPASVEKCTPFVNLTITQAKVGSSDDIFVLYTVSFWYYSAVSTATVVIVGLVISLLTKKGNVTINKNLLSPMVHFALRKEPPPSVYYNVNTKGDDIDAIHELNSKD